MAHIPGLAVGKQMCDTSMMGASQNSPSKGFEPLVTGFDGSGGEWLLLGDEGR